jgi:hypothetical protein
LNKEKTPKEQLVEVKGKISMILAEVGSHETTTRAKEAMEPRHGCATRTCLCHKDMSIKNTERISSINVIVIFLSKYRMHNFI